LPSPSEPERRRAAGAWVVYDLANTIFALGVVGLYLPEWMTRSGVPDAALAVTQATAGVLVILGAPWVGARSDHRRRRMPALITTTLIAVTATMFLTTGPVALTFALLGLALVALNIGSVVYDALLPTVSTEETRGILSGRGVGVGYLGSFVGLGIGYLTLEVLDLGYAAAFRAMAVAFLLFALPAFRWIREGQRPPLPGPPPRLRRVAVDLVGSWRRASRYPAVMRFLIARFLYTDAINTLVGGFLTIFAIEELDLDSAGARNLLGIAIVGAIAGGILGGRLVERRGPADVLRTVLAMWVVAIGSGVVAAVTGFTELGWAIGPIGGFALGGTWAADRVIMIRVSPPRHLGEFYGLYATVGRFATIVGPLAWALIVDVLGWGRTAAIGALGLFIAAGWWTLRGLDDSRRVWPAELV
jgi:MFS transporter, UMF1 family